jgi:D-3-phosphoglycerate dehydrogenase / 2-oxoglutarate reductase
MKVKLECPVDFTSTSEIENLMSSAGCELAEHDNDVQCLIVNPGTEYFLDKKYLSRFKSLKVVGTPSTGVNHIDCAYLDKENISVKCLLDDRPALDDIHASAEFTWLHIMNSVRKFNLAVQNKHHWREKENEQYLRSNELHGKKIGIIGMGRIGKKVAKYAYAFGMKVYWHDPYVEYEPGQTPALFNVLNRVKNLQGLSSCDIISVNCYLTSETKNLITYGVFDNFKEGLVVVNTSRGEVVDEKYIYDLIIGGKLIYSADVLCDEQDINTLYRSKLFNLEHANITITPHVAGATVESQTKALKSILSLCKNV